MPTNIFQILNFSNSLLNEGVSDMWKRLKEENIDKKVIDNAKEQWNVLSKQLSGAKKDKISYQHFLKKTDGHTPSDWLDLLDQEYKKFKEKNLEKSSITGKSWDDKETIKVVWQNDDWILFMFYSFGGLQYFRDNCMLKCRDDNFTKQEVDDKGYFNETKDSVEDYLKSLANSNHYIKPTWCVSKKSQYWHDYSLGTKDKPKCFVFASKLHANWKFIFTMNSEDEILELRDIEQSGSAALRIDRAKEMIEKSFGDYDFIFELVKKAMNNKTYQMEKEEIVKKFPDIDSRESVNEFLRYVMNGDMKSVKQYLDSGMDISREVEEPEEDDVDENGNGPDDEDYEDPCYFYRMGNSLNVAVAAGNIDMVNFLLKNNVQETCNLEKREFPITTAAKMERYDIVDLLVEQGVNPNLDMGFENFCHLSYMYDNLVRKDNKDPQTFLYYLKLFLNNNLNPKCLIKTRCRGDRGNFIYCYRQLMYYAVALDDFELAQELESKGVPHHAKNVSPLSDPYSLALQEDKEKFIKYFDSLDRNIDITSENSINLYLRALQCGDLKTVKKFIKAGIKSTELINTSLGEREHYQSPFNIVLCSHESSNEQKIDIINYFISLGDKIPTKNDDLFGNTYKQFEITCFNDLLIENNMELFSYIYKNADKLPPIYRMPPCYEVLANFEKFIKDVTAEDFEKYWYPTLKDMILKEDVKDPNRKYRSLLWYERKEDYATGALGTILYYGFIKNENDIVNRILSFGINVQKFYDILNLNKTKIKNVLKKLIQEKRIADAKKLINNRTEKLYANDSFSKDDGLIPLTINAGDDSLFDLVFQASDRNYFKGYDADRNACYDFKSAIDSDYIHGAEIMFEVGLKDSIVSNYLDQYTKFKVYNYCMEHGSRQMINLLKKHIPDIEREVNS